MLTAPAGRYSVEVSHGPEYRVVNRTVEVSPDAAATVVVTLRRLDDLPARGWYSADPLSSIPANEWREPVAKPLIFSEFGADARVRVPQRFDQRRRLPRVDQARA